MVKETELTSWGTKSPRIGLDKFTSAEQRRRKNHKESISQHFLLITASESWMLKLPSGIASFLHCTSVPRAWQGLIPFMSSPWMTSSDWIIPEHPIPTKASFMCTFQQWDPHRVLESALCAHSRSEIHTGSSFMCTFQQGDRHRILTPLQPYVHLCMI